MLLVADDANAAYSNPRPLPKCAQTLLPCIRLAYRTPRGPDAVACPTQKPHLPVSELVVTLLSRIWDTEGKTSPPRTGPGGAKRLGNRHRMTTRAPTVAAPVTGQAAATRDRASQATRATGSRRTRATGSRRSSTAALTASSRTRISTG